MSAIARHSRFHLTDSRCLDSADAAASGELCRGLRPAIRSPSKPIPIPSAPLARHSRPIPPSPKAVTPTEMPTTGEAEARACRRYRRGGHGPASGQYATAEHATADDDHTTTTTQNPDGSTTQHEETQATTSCRRSHESRTFGRSCKRIKPSGPRRPARHAESLEVAHLALDLAGDCLAVGLLWQPAGGLQSMGLVLHGPANLVIATASIAAYRIIFVGGGQTT